MAASGPSFPGSVGSGVVADQDTAVAARAAEAGADSMAAVQLAASVVGIEAVDQVALGILEAVELDTVGAAAVEARTVQVGAEAEHTDPDQVDMG
jgi:hypothetical protein